MRISINHVNGVLCVLWASLAGLVLPFSVTEAQAQSEASIPDEVLRQESFSKSPSDGHSDEGTKIQVEGFIDYTTSARIYPASRDADPSISSTYNSFSGFLSPGADVRVVLSRSNVVGLTMQYLTAKQTIYDIYGYDKLDRYVGVPVNDGFSLWVIELNGYFNIPILGERWNICLGGGPRYTSGSGT